MNFMSLMSAFGSGEGLGNIEQMGKDFVDHMQNTQKGLSNTQRTLDAILLNQHSIMTNLGIEDQFIRPKKP